MVDRAIADDILSVGWLIARTTSTRANTASRRRSSSWWRIGGRIFSPDPRPTAPDRRHAPSQPACRHPIGLNLALKCSHVAVPRSPCLDQLAARDQQHHQPGQPGIVAVGRRVGFSFREYIHNPNADRTALALRMVTHFAARGEDAELATAGQLLCRDYPRLWEIAEAGNAAKKNVRPHWRPKRRRPTVTRQVYQSPARCSPPG